MPVVAILVFEKSNLSCNCNKEVDLHFLSHERRVADTTGHGRTQERHVEIMNPKFITFRMMNPGFST